jgi:hypothetical protein
MKDHGLSNPPKILVGFSLDFLLPYQLCFSLIHYLNISTNVKVFSMQCYQLYAYPGFWAWVTGSLLWARHSDRKWRKIDSSLKKFKNLWCDLLPYMCIQMYNCRPSQWPNFKMAATYILLSVVKYKLNKYIRSRDSTDLVCLPVT